MNVKVESTWWSGPGVGGPQKPSSGSVSVFDETAILFFCRHHKDEVAGDIFDMLLTFTDFLAFKEMFLDYRAEKEGRGLDLSSGLVVTSLCKSSSVPASQNDLRP